jgi:hypothetical protein
MIFLVASVLLVFLPITYMHSSFPTFVLYSQPISAFVIIILIILSEEYKSRISSIPSFLHLHAMSLLCGINILLSTCSQTPTVHIPSLMKDAFIPTQNHRQHYNYAYSNFYFSSAADEKTGGSGQTGIKYYQNPISS